MNMFLNGLFNKKIESIMKYCLVLLVFLFDTCIMVKKTTIKNTTFENIFFENICIEDTGKMELPLNKYSNNNTLYNLRSNSSEFQYSINKKKCKFGDTITLLDNYKTLEIFYLRRKSSNAYREITYKLKSHKGIENKRIFVYNVFRYFSEEKLKNNDEIILDKSKNCLNEMTIGFEAFGSSTCVSIKDNEDNTVYEKCVPSIEPLIIDIDSITNGIYWLYYNCGYFKVKKKIIVID